jgi:NAD(P)-dependent dehydrogenase (short-subunit alcohol dehydrogenase family)
MIEGEGTSGALVLGGAGGIGSAVSRRLAADHAVAIGYRRDGDRAGELVERIGSEGGDAVAVPADATTDDGRIVMLSSAATDAAPPRQSVYAAAKAGVEVAAKELAARCISVNVVRPGATDTATLQTGTSEEAIVAMAAANAMGRPGTPMTSRPWWPCSARPTRPE